MHESELEIKTGNREIAQKLVECGNSQKPFELCGVKYLVTGVSREIGASSVATSATMRQVVLPEWRGPEDGLPPVGLECIFRTALDMIYTVKVIAHGVDEGRNFAVAQAKDDIFMGGAEMFERILSPEEVEQQESEKGISALHQIMDGPGYRQAAERLYKAGVRAPEVK